MSSRAPNDLIGLISSQTRGAHEGDDEFDLCALIRGCVDANDAPEDLHKLFAYAEA